MHQLSLDLQPDDEEEEGHQAVVDQVLQVFRQGEDVDVDGELGVPEVCVLVGPGGVRQAEGGCGGQQQHDCAGLLGVDELL